MVYSFRGRPYRSRTGLPLLSSTVRSHRHMPGGTSGKSGPAWSRGTRGAGSKAATKGEARKDAGRSPTCAPPLPYWHQAVDGSTKVIIKLNVQTATVAFTMFSPPADTGFLYFLYPAYLTTPFTERGALLIKNKHPSINGKQGSVLPDRRPKNGPRERNTLAVSAEKGLLAPKPIHFATLPPPDILTFALFSRTMSV